MPNVVLSQLLASAPKEALGILPHGAPAMSVVAQLGAA